MVTPENEAPLELRTEEPDRLSTWEYARLYFLTLARSCYFYCPPVPECITRKVAFHPPPAPLSYKLQLLYQPHIVVSNAAEVYGREFTIISARDTIRVPEVREEIFRTTRFFSVKTRHNSFLVVSYSRPRQTTLSGRCHSQVLIFAQPNSTDLSSWTTPLTTHNVMEQADFLQCDVVAFDYSGYGCSSGYPSEANMYRDIEAVYEFVRDIAPEKEIVLSGYSIGTAAAIHLASTQPRALSGLILIAPFTSGLRAMTSRKTSKSMPFCGTFDRFNNIEKIRLVEVPTLICHGTLDLMIPVEHGTILYNQLKHPVPMLVLHGADHSSVFNGRLWDTLVRIGRFLREETRVLADTTRQPDEQLDRSDEALRECAPAESMMTVDLGSP